MEIVTRGNLPHWYVPRAAHFVTYRLAGTLPADVLESLAARKNQLLARPRPDGMTAAQRRGQVHKQLFAEYDRYLDDNRSVDWLGPPAVATMIRRNLYHHNGAKYHLLAYCIMPNHVHVLLQPVEAADEAGFVNEKDDEAGRFVYEPCGEQADRRSPLTSIMHSLKSYTAHEGNRLLGRTGIFWQHESYDHWVRNDEELERVVEYINANPVKAGLVTRPHDWPFGSAHDRLLFDGATSGFLGDTGESSL